jgi:hypothetical protein
MDTSGVRWIDLPHVRDERGVLTAIEAFDDVPFAIQRVFFIHGARSQRGGHAHLETTQLLIPLAGRFRVEIFDGVSWSRYEMCDPNRGLLLPPVTWVEMRDFSPTAVCLVLADTSYAADIFIRDRQQLAALRHREATW